MPLSQPAYTALRCFTSPGGWVMTRGDGSVLSWPVHPEPDQPHVLRVGPPRHLAKGNGAGASASPDGAVMVVANNNSARLHHRDRPDIRLVLQPQIDVRSTAVSPDKRWVVTSSFHGQEPNPWVRIWNAQTGAHERDLDLHGTTWAGFSPDSRWLATRTLGQDCRLWEVGTWREVRRYPHAEFAFSPDERTLALDDVHGQVRLVETATDCEIGRLVGPEPIWYDPACFSPDRTRLIAVARNRRAVYIWDLRMIRQGLKAMGLYWDLPEFPPALPPVRPLQVRVDAGFFRPYADFPDANHAVAAYTIGLAHLPINPEAYLQRGLAYARLQQGQRAIADYSIFLALSPPSDPRRAEILYRRSQNNAKLKDFAAELHDLLEMASLNLDCLPWPREVADRCNEAAWSLLGTPETERRTDKAMLLAKAAVALEPNSGAYGNSLGMAYYRLGRWRDAIATLEPNLERNAGFAAWDYYILAMAYHQLGDGAKAKDYFDRAVSWHEAKAKETDFQARYRAELNAYRAEAEALLK